MVRETGGPVSGCFLAPDGGLFSFALLVITGFDNISTRVAVSKERRGSISVLQHDVYNK